MCRFTFICMKGVHKCKKTHFSDCEQSASKFVQDRDRHKDDMGTKMIWVTQR